MDAENYTAALSNGSFTVTEAAGEALPGDEDYIAWDKGSFTTTEADADIQLQLQLNDEDANTPSHCN